MNWLDKFKFDKKFSTDKIKIEGWEKQSPMKCLTKDGKIIGTSTGDVSIIYSIDDGVSWNKTNLSIELKRGSDFSSTLYSSWNRFKNELDRANGNGVDFFIVHNQSTRQMYEQFEKLKYMGKVKGFSNPEKVVYTRVIEIQKEYKIPIIYTHEIEEVVKRIIKYYVTKEKLQYRE